MEKKKLKLAETQVEQFEVEGKSLWSLLEQLDFLDNEEELQVSESRKVMEAVKDKSDAYSWVNMKYQQEIGRMDQIIKAFQAKKKALSNGQSRFKAHIANVIDAFVTPDENGKRVLEGNLYKVHRTSSNKCVPLVEANPLQVVALGKYINITYKWRVDEIKRNLGKDPDLEGIAKIVPTESVRFTEKKGV